jgi:hypothetical protein
MKHIIHILAIIFFFNASPSPAETPEDKGLAIAKEDDKRDNGFQDFTANMLMVLKTGRGKKAP